MLFNFGFFLPTKQLIIFAEEPEATNKHKFVEEYVHHIRIILSDRNVPNRRSSNDMTRTSLFQRKQGNNTDDDDEFSLDRKDGIKRPEVKRQAMESMEAIEKGYRVKPATQQHNDDFSLDRMDGIKRPEVKKKVLEDVQELNSNKDFGMFTDCGMPSLSRSKKNILLEEQLMGRIMKDQITQSSAIKDLYQQMAFDTLDGVKGKKKDSLTATKADLAYASQLMEDEEYDAFSDLLNPVSYEEIICDPADMNISEMTTRSSQHAS